MFDIGFWEMAFIGVIALVVIGPEKLPGVARTVGLWVGKGRRMVRDIKSDVKKEMDAQDLANIKELKNEFSSATNDLKDMAKVDIDKDPLGIKEAGQGIKDSVNKESEAAANSSKPAAKKKAKKKSSGRKKTAVKKSPVKRATKKAAAKTNTAKKSAAKPADTNSKLSRKPAKKTSKKSASSSVTTATSRKTGSKKASKKQPKTSSSDADKQSA